MSSNGTTASLESVFDFKNGRSFKKSEWKVSGPIVRIQNLNNEAAPFNYFQGSYDDAIEVNDGDLLFSWSGTVGSSFGAHIWNRGKSVLNQHIFRVSLKNGIDKRYAYHALQYITAEIEKKVNGAVGLVHITKAKLNRFEIPDPPLAEQRRIVAILDVAFAGIAAAVVHAEQNLANARELFESYLNGVFAQRGNGWVEKRLGGVCENLDSKRIPITKSKRKSGDIPYYGASGIVDHVADFIFDEELLLVSEDGANLLARTYPIAFSVSGRTWVNNHAHILRFGDMGSQKFVEYYLNSISLKPYVSGMAQPKLNQASLNSITVPFASKSEHERIVAKLDALTDETRRLESIYQRKLANLAELKQSILRKAFAGELTADVVEEVEKAESEELRAEGQRNVKVKKAPSPQPSPNGKGSKKVEAVA